ncbi:MAG: SRPBCC family protein [Polaromonas sp.]|uniref:SRPBCC family protein n=1 Tax=Polaromonas sp. TaxID=1869339 RepID=UPI0040368EF0
MNIVNVHQRRLEATPAQVAELMASLGSPDDKLWPAGWPRIQFDRPLAPGAVGGHGPIGYVVTAYTPGEAIRFRFTKPKGFNGWHSFSVLDATDDYCFLEHRVEMQTEGRATLMWELAIRHLHNALVEDALSQAQRAVGNKPLVVPWPARVRLLRWLLSVGQSTPRTAPGNAHAR